VDDVHSDEVDSAEVDLDEPVTGPDLARQALAQARSMTGAGGSATQARAQRNARRRTRNRAANLGRREWSGSGADDRDPQPVGSLMRRLLDERGWHKDMTVARLFADWAALVGEEVAAHCTPVELRDGELRLSAASSAWATQIRLLAPTLLARLSTQLGAGVVTGVSVTGPSGPSWKHGRRSVPGARGPRDTYG
jgi:predicted nucleic acid-binding Zn ribbon protein